VLERELDITQELGMNQYKKKIMLDLFAILFHIEQRAKRA